jgi:3-oxoacyl-[acyl-carrier protein] reductase
MTVTASAPTIRLTGKRVLLTGGTRGIGRGIALALARAGATVVTCYRSDEDAATRLSADLAQLGQPDRGGHHVVRADITEPADLTRLVETCAERLGGLDAVVTNAGAITHVPFAKLTLDGWRKVIDTNLTATYALVRATLPLLGPGASVVALGSRSAMVGIPLRAHYTASKAGIVGLVRSLAKELGPREIRVNVVAPGVIAPEDEELSPEIEQRYKFLTALGRLGRGDEVAGAVMFLVSDLSSYLTGETMHVDGGI